MDSHVMFKALERFMNDPQKSFTKQQWISKLLEAGIVSRGFVGRIRAGIIFRSYWSHQPGIDSPEVICFERTTGGQLKLVHYGTGIF